MRSSLLLVAVLSSALAGLAGCGAGAAHPTLTAAPAASPPAAAPADTTPPDLEMVTATVQGKPFSGLVPRVVLLDPGHGERQPLRLHAVDRTAQLDAVIVQQIRGKSPDAAPGRATIARLSLMASSRDRDGAIEIGLKVVDAKLEHHDDVDAGGGLGRAEALAGHYLGVLVSDRGQVIATLTSAPDGAADAVQEALSRAITVPLPVEPIGLGARWRVRQVVPMSTMVPIAALEEDTYELSERPSDKMALIKHTAMRVVLMDGARLLTTRDEDDAAAQRAMTRETRTSMEALGRHRDPIAHGDGLAVFLPIAPQFGSCQHTVRLEGNTKIVAPDGTATSEQRMVVTDQTTIQLHDDPADGKAAPEAAR